MISGSRSSFSCIISSTWVKVFISCSLSNNCSRLYHNAEVCHRAETCSSTFKPWNNELSLVIVLSEKVPGAICTSISKGHVSVNTMREGVQVLQVVISDWRISVRVKFFFQHHLRFVACKTARTFSRSLISACSSQRTAAAPLVHMRIEVDVVASWIHEAAPSLLAFWRAESLQQKLLVDPLLTLEGRVWSSRGWQNLPPHQIGDQAKLMLSMP